METRDQATVTEEPAPVHGKLRRSGDASWSRHGTQVEVMAPRSRSRLIARGNSLGHWPAPTTHISERGEDPATHRLGGGAHAHI